MARSFSNAKILSVFVADGIFNAIFRRGYAAGSQGVASSVARGGVGASRSVAATLKKTGEEGKGSTVKEPWVPDPKTGCYRPDNGAKEIDPAELRAILLTNKN